MGITSDPIILGPRYYQYFWEVNVPCSRTQHGLTRVGLERPTSVGEEGGGQGLCLISRRNDPVGVFVSKRAWLT